MGNYNATSSWRKIVSNAEYVTLTTTGKVRVFIGEASPTNGWDAGVILRGDSTLELGDVANQGGNVFVKGEGEVTLQADPGAQKAPSDDTGTETDGSGDGGGTPAPSGAPKVIFSTDAGGDVDDLLAMAEVFTAHRKGKIDLVALTASASTAHQAPFLRMAADIFGCADIPVGAYKGSGAVPVQNTYNEELSQLFGAPNQTRNDLPSARKIYRQVLSRLPKGEKVTVVVIGFLTDLAEFVRSRDGDDGVAGSGKQLLEDHVERIVTQGIDSIGSTDLRANWGKNPNATADVMEACAARGVSVIVLPSQESTNVLTGPPAKWKLHSNPLTLGWFMRNTVTRPSYDSMALHYALGTKPRNWKFSHRDIHAWVDTRRKQFRYDAKKKGVFSFLKTAISDAAFTRDMKALNEASDINVDTYPQYHIAKHKTAYSLTVPGTPSVSTGVAKVSGRDSGKFSLSGRKLSISAQSAGLYETELELTAKRYTAKQFARVKVMPGLGGYDLGDAFGSKSTNYDVWLCDDLGAFFKDRSTNPRTPAKIGDRVGTWIGAYRGLAFVAESDAARPILRSNPKVPGTYRLEFSGGQAMECAEMTALDRSSGSCYAGAAYEISGSKPGYVFRDGASTTDYRKMGCALAVNMLADAKGSVFTVRKLCSALPKPSGPAVTLAGWSADTNTGDIMQNTGGFRTTKIGTSGASGAMRLGGGRSGARLTGFISGFVGCQRPLDDKRTEFLRQLLARQNGAPV